MKKMTVNIMCLLLASLSFDPVFADTVDHNLPPAETVRQPTMGEITGNSSVSAVSRNVILLIGDGMDDHQITIARNYLVGTTGRLTLDTMTSRSAVQVLTVSEAYPSQPVYVADSANSATALATGRVTSRGRIATSANEDADLTTIVELAAAAGIKTGLISTASVTDATVAAFYAHISLRACENPDLMKDALIFDRIVIDCSPDQTANGGLGSISEQLAASSLDLVLGGGQDHFTPAAEGQNISVQAVAEAAGFNVLTTIDQLNSAPLDNRWLGLFAPTTLPVRLQGENGRAAEKPEPSIMNRIHWSQGTVTLPEPMTCEENPDFDGTPSLKLMTDRALAHLSENSTNGFFLMIESASIDKQSHLRQACGSIGEVAQLDEALQSALAFAEGHPETLIIVTADHGQAAQLVPTQSLFEPFNLPIYTPGKIVRIRTPENAVMTVNYATNEFFLEEHTGVNVPALTNRSNLLPSMLTQPDLFDIMIHHLNLEK